MLSSWSGSWNQMTLASTVKRTVCSMLSLERIMCCDWRNVRTRRTRNCQYQAVGHFCTLNPLLLSSSPPLMLLDSEEGSLLDKSVSVGSSETGFVGAFPGTFGLDGYTLLSSDCRCTLLLKRLVNSPPFSPPLPLSGHVTADPSPSQHFHHHCVSNTVPTSCDTMVYQYYLNRSHYYNKSQEISMNFINLFFGRVSCWGSSPMSTLRVSSAVTISTAKRIFIILHSIRFTYKGVQITILHVVSYILTDIVCRVVVKCAVEATISEVGNYFVRRTKIGHLHGKE